MKNAYDFLHLSENLSYGIRSRTVNAKHSLNKTKRISLVTRNINLCTHISFGINFINLLYIFRRCQFLSRNEQTNKKLHIHDTQTHTQNKSYKPCSCHESTFAA